MDINEELKKYPKHWHLEEFYCMGYARGLEKRESIILKFIDELGIDEVVRISGLSREEIENYLNREILFFHDI